MRGSGFRVRIVAPIALGSWLPPAWLAGRAPTTNTQFGAQSDARWRQLFTSVYVPKDSGRLNPADVNAA
jgi:hypothetical protein